MTLLGVYVAKGYLSEWATKQSRMMAGIHILTPVFAFTLPTLQNGPPSEAAE